MKFAKLAILASAMAVTPIAANAQDVGATVYGNDDAPIGTVISNDGTTVTVDTGKHQAPLPGAAIGEQEGKFVVAATKGQIDAMMDQQMAQLEAQQAEAEAARQAAIAEAAAKRDAALVVGAPIWTADAQTLGMVEEFVGENVVVKAEDSSLITLPRNIMSVNDEGNLYARANLADILAAVGG